MGVEESHAHWMKQKESFEMMKNQIAEAPLYYAYKNQLGTWAVSSERFDWCTHTVKIVDVKPIEDTK